MHVCVFCFFLRNGIAATVMSAAAAGTTSDVISPALEKCTLDIYVMFRFFVKCFCIVFLLLSY